MRTAMNKNNISTAEHFRKYPQLLLEGSLSRGREILLRDLIKIGTRLYRETRCLLISVDITGDGTVEVGFRGGISSAAELEKLKRKNVGELDVQRLGLFKAIAFSSSATLSFPSEQKRRVVVLNFRRGKFVSRETRPAQSDPAVTVRFLPDRDILGEGNYDIEQVRTYLEHIALLNAGLTIWFKGKGTYFKTAGTAGLFQEFFPETDPDTVFTWCSPVFEFTIGRASGGQPGVIRSFAGDRETVDGGIHVDNFKLGMTIALWYCTKRFVPPEKLFRDWNVVIAVHLNDPMFESGYVCRLGGDLGPFFCMMTNKVMLDHLTHSPKNLEIFTGKRKDMIKSSPAKRNVKKWFDQVMKSPELLEERKCPSDKFTPVQWKELILTHPSALQFDPPEEELKEILTKGDFEDWTGYDVCTALFMDGVWLSEILPLDKIMQEDFDDFFGAEAFPDAEEFWDVVPDYFPQGIPPHIKPPYPKPKKPR
ncbi:MAG: hypothetical protein E7055_12805 [Lentisphaerae bacterium]|nr:hypothetical protein [Lentisphaerota bacterium]